MRITESQLRRIIRTEARRIRESQEVLMSMGSGGAAVATALDEIGADWYDRWNPGDPSMAAVGQAGWNAQVDSALESLAEAIANAYDQIEAGLTNGDYAHASKIGYADARLSESQALGFILTGRNVSDEDDPFASMSNRDKKAFKASYDSEEEAEAMQKKLAAAYPGISFAVKMLATRSGY